VPSQFRESPAEAKGRGRVARRRWIKPTAIAAMVATAALIWFVEAILDWGSSRLSARSEGTVIVSTTSSPFSAPRGKSLPPSFVFEAELAEIPPPPPEYEASRWDWGADAGGVDADYTEVSVIVEATTDAAVVILGLDVTVIERRDPAEGILLRSLGGDLIDVRYVSIDLDADPPEVARGSGLLEGEGDWDFPLSVSPSDLEVFHLFASTESCDCLWVADLEYIYRGTEGKVRLDDGGEPFRTTSTQNTDEYLIDPDGNVLPSDEFWAD
jgi:hypothetical protein